MPVTSIQSDRFVNAYFPAKNASYQSQAGLMRGLQPITVTFPYTLRIILCEYNKVLGFK